MCKLATQVRAEEAGPTGNRNSQRLPEWGHFLLSCFVFVGHGHWSLLS